MRRTSLAWSAVIGISAVIAHAYGYAFGISNQATYFLQALQHAHPEVLQHDWLVTSTSQYHALFGMLAGLVYDDAGTAFGIAHVVLMIALCCGVFLVVTGATTRAALPIFLLVIGWITVNGLHSVAGSYLWSGYLQPSLIGSVGWIVALALHLRGRPLATGIALACGGIFHVNFLMLGIGVFGLAELLDVRPGRLKRLALLLAPQLLALAVLAPEILAHSSSTDPDHALWVLVRFHAPVHYKPSWIARTLPSLVRWIALAVVVAPLASDFGKRVAVRRLLWWSVIAAVVCVGGALVMLIPALLPLTRLYVWRLAPFATAAAQVVIALAIAETIENPRAWRACAMWRRIAAAGLVVWIAASAPFMTSAPADWSIWIAVVAVAIAIFFAPARSFLFVVAAVATLAAPLWYRRAELVHPATGISEGGDADALYAWARTTPIDAVFLTPPDLYRFRLIARRAIYADFKSPPLAPDGLIEWHARLCRMDGALLTDKIPTHRKDWADTPGDVLLSRARELGADYLVIDRSPPHDRIAAQPVFANVAFAVYAIR